MPDVFKSALNRTFARYALAVAAVAASLLLHDVLLRQLGLHLPPFILLYPAVMAVALLAGFWPGVLATVLAVLGTDYLFLPPFGHFEIANRSDFAMLALFTAMGTFVSLLAEHYRRSKQQQQARNVQQRQAEMMRLSFDAISVLRMDGGVESWNQGAEQLYGYSESEALGCDPHRLLETTPAVPWMEVIATLRKQGNCEYEQRQRTKDGRVVIASTRYQLIAGLDGIERILKISRDITMRKLAEVHIRRLNRMYAILSDINQTIVREKNSTAILEAACRIAVDKGEFRMAWIGMINPATQMLESVASYGAVGDYLDHVRVNLLDQLQSSGPAASCIRTGEHAICNDIEHDPAYELFRDQALRHGFRSSGGFPLKIDGQVAGVLNLYAAEPGWFEEDELQLLDEMAMDIGFALEVNRREEERRKAEEELRWRTAFFEAGVDCSLDGVLVVDSQGKKLLQNQRMVQMLKIPAHISENPDDSQQLQYAAQLMKNPDQFTEKVNYLNSHPNEVSRDEIELRDGRIMDRYSAPVRDKAQNYYGRIWTFRDITEQRQLEVQYRQSQKMEAVGQLTGGIAHDFNNLLTVILGCTEVMLDEFKANPRLSKMAEMILNAGQRGADLTHRMLAFARRQTLQPTPVNLNRLLTDMEVLLRRTLRANIALDIVPGDGDCVAMVDLSQLESALLNLCLNAQDAMPGGGTLTIEIESAVLDAAYARQNPDVTPGKYILITISDTGCGISPENLRRVFDPFFTTKEVGKGTGLGLSMVYGFAKQSQGHVKIYSELGRGTSVKLYLPHAPQQIDLGAQNQPPALADLRGSELILLVEDDHSVREYAKFQLEHLGYRVLQATNGAEALKVLEERGDIDLLFTDMVMPGKLNGRELAEEARKFNPKLKVLYSSGYAENAMLHQGLLDKATKMLNKPYTRQELSRKIRDALTER